MTATRFRLAVAPIFAFALLFPILAFDVLVRLGSRPEGFAGDARLLFWIELLRGVRGVLGIALAAALMKSVVRRDYGRALVVFLLFATIASTMTGGGYVGPLQERLVGWLMSAGFSRGQMLILFAVPLWAVWLSLPGLLRFALLFPRPLTAADIERSGASDRPGLMRGVPGAGTDVGAALRALLSRMLLEDWLHPTRVWTVCLAGAALAITLRTSEAQPLLWIGIAAIATVAITALRASYVVAEPDDRRRIIWLARSAVIALVLFAVAAGLSVGESVSREMIALILLSAAPAVMFAGITAAVLGGRASA